MNGPEHYLAAERALAHAERHTNEDPGDMRIAEVSAATAQVHATLALAAATALSTVTEEAPQFEYDAWADAAGVRPSARCVSCKGPLTRQGGAWSHLGTPGCDALIVPEVLQ